MKGLGRDRRIGLLAGEGEAGQRAVGLFNLNAGDGSVGGHGKREPRDALLLPFGLAGERERPFGRRRQRQVAQLLFQFRVAEQKAQGRAQIVQLFGRDALDLRVAAGVEPGILAVEQEELAGRRRCTPTSCGRV